jgi:hypothetical protein
MDKKGTTVKSKTTTVKAAVKPVVKKVEVVKSAPVNSNIDWMTITGLVAGALSYIGYLLLSNVQITMGENVQIAIVITMAVFGIAGTVFSILAIICASKDYTKHMLFGLNIIGLVVSLLAFDKFLSPLISVITYLAQK